MNFGRKFVSGSYSVQVRFSRFDDARCFVKVGVEVAILKTRKIDGKTTRCCAGMQKYSKNEKFKSFKEKLFEKNLFR